MLASTDLKFWDIDPNEYPQTLYKLWDSDIGYVEVTVTGWLATAIDRSGMKAPRRAQFKSQGQWINVSQFALNRAIKAARRVPANGSN